MSAKVLLTGISGFLGNCIAAKLVQNNYDVISLSRTAPCFLSPLVKWVKCDLSRLEEVRSISNVFNDVEYVVHAAAQIPGLDNQNCASAFILNNVTATINLLESINNKITKFIYCSTLDVYGKSDRLPITELHLTNPSTYYGVAKLMCEHIINISYQQTSTQIIILRFTQLYGPGEPPIKIIPKLINHILKEKETIIANQGQDIRDYLFIEDAADSVIESLKKPIRGIFNISSGKGVSISNVVEELQSISKQRFKITYQPLLEKSVSIIDNSKFCRQTDWRPATTLFDGLSKHYEFEYNRQI